MSWQITIGTKREHSMSIWELKESEAEGLLKMSKYPKEKKEYKFPGLGGGIEIPLESKNKREDFVLDIYRGKIQLAKVSFQNRARKNIILVRVDLGGSPHRNPNDEPVLCPHIHLYREGFGDKWAYPLPKEFTDYKNITKTLDDFMRFCNIEERPSIDMDLFV